MSNEPTDKELQELADSMDTSNSRVVFTHNGQQLTSFDQIWPIIVEYINSQTTGNTTDNTTTQ